jgi:hypothetical protein
MKSPLARHLAEIAKWAYNWLHGFIQHRTVRRLGAAGFHFVNPLWTRSTKDGSTSGL